MCIFSHTRHIFGNIYADPRPLLMAEDPLDSLLGLEEDFYQEGYDLGTADGAHAGLIEGKLFGVEKGYEKALALGRLHGRAVVWQMRCIEETEDNSAASRPSSRATSSAKDGNGLSVTDLPKIKANPRLRKHMDGLATLTNSSAISPHNDDQAVAEFDERLARAHAKAKLITSIIGEKLNSEDEFERRGDGTTTTSSIEDTDNMVARH